MDGSADGSSGGAGTQLPPGLCAGTWALGGLSHAAAVLPAALPCCDFGPPQPFSEILLFLRGRGIKIPERSGEGSLWKTLPSFKSKCVRGSRHTFQK